MSEPKKNKTGKPRKPPADVRKLQDPEYDEDAFDQALEKATRRTNEPESPAPTSRRR
jgi:hypothetical protein